MSKKSNRSRKQIRSPKHHAHAPEEPDFLPFNRKDFDRELRERNGDEWMEEHRALLDAQWEYIESL